MPPEEVPAGRAATFGLWTGLANQAIQAYEKGEVLVVKVKDRAEYKKLVNGMSEKLRQEGFARNFAAVDEPDGSVKAYLRLSEKDPPAGVGARTNGTSSRPRRRGAVRKVRL